MKFSKQEVKNLLKANDIPFKEKFNVNGVDYDFLIGENTLLMIKPLSESKFDEVNGTLKDKKRDIEESNNILNTTYECIHWYEHYDVDKMIDFLKSKANDNPEFKVYARKLDVREVDPKIAKDFIDENHLLGLAKKSVKNIGLYDGDTLVSCMSFSPATNTKANKNLFKVDDLDGCWELIRFCSKKDYAVVGGANKIFKKFVEDNKPKGIMTYSDYNLGKGNIYLKLGFSVVKKPGVNCFWSHPKDPKLFINDNLMRNGTDRILPKYQDQFGYKYFKLGMDFNKFVKNGGLEVWGDWWKKNKDVALDENNWPGNVDNMRMYSFVRVYDCGYTTFKWVKE